MKEKWKATTESEAMAVVKALMDQGMAVAVSHPGWPEQKTKRTWWLLRTLEDVAYNDSESGLWIVNQKILKKVVDSPGVPVR